MARSGSVRHALGFVLHATRLSTVRYCVIAILGLGIAASLGAQELFLSNGRNGLTIATEASPSEVDQFAASELARYLKQMTGVEFPVTKTATIPESALVVGRKAVASLDPEFSHLQLGDDGFLIRRQHGRILIAGASDRGTLYGVYAFLEKLGCRWFAPNFVYYGAAHGELVPHVPRPRVGDWNIVERPAFQWRKLYVEEGRSHTAENLKEMIDWMAKARMNVLDCPIDYQHFHHTEWDHWRLALIPELRKRGILIEVGGHGYPNFLPPEKYFNQHPDWFGMKDGKRTDDPRVVFSTANKDAVQTFISNVKSYLSGHPEIDILDVWPPDGAEWSEAPEDLALGSSTERQMLLLNTLSAALKPDFPRLRLQFIAYETYTVPPSVHKPARGIFMDFCPINRSFESPLYASGDATNEEYFHDLQGWVQNVMDPSDITIYSYFTKYAWRSLPVLVPHLIVAETRRFHSMGIGGLATYSEPGSWGTYELDHYITARALWNPQIDAEQEVADYTRARYGAAWKPVLAYLNLVEEVVPHAIGIPGTDLTIEKQHMMIHDFEPADGLLTQAQASTAQDPAVQILLAKLEHEHAYVKNEMDLRLALLMDVKGRGRPTTLANLLAERDKILRANPTDGVILQDGHTP